MKTRISLFLLCFLIVFSLKSQNKDVSYTIHSSAGLSSDTTLPFWLSANQFGSVPNSDYGLLNTAIFKDYDTPNTLFDLSYKASATGFIAQENKLLVNELYLGVRFKNIVLDIGAKNDAVLWNNLSSSNGSIIKSINARAMPGITIKTNNFITLPFATSWLEVKANFAHYFMDDTRFVDNTNLHHKSLYFKTTLSPTFEVIAGLDHYAQWGGTSPQYGAQPRSFKDYVRIIFGAEGGDGATQGDQNNALGNHLGAYLLQLNYNKENIGLNFYYSHPFEDTSGREMSNWQDGLFGVFVDFKKNKSIVNSVLLEFTYTKNMSNIPRSDVGPDNYFNNGIYNSGWTYHGNTIGSPYFTPKPVDDNGITSGVIVGDNRFAAFNIGAAGFVKEISYKAMLSHTTYYGWFGQEYDPNPYQFSGILDVVIPQDIFKLPFDVAASFAFDAGTYRSQNFGAFLSITKTGSF
ncbi:capsule assembly Wzi family protein [Flavobacteriaceae bacterium]|nr:capsule assembly Wzi family protein [Flavobacteriaceae bacterium]